MLTEHLETRVLVTKGIQILELAKIKKSRDELPSILMYTWRGINPPIKNMYKTASAALKAAERAGYELSFLLIE